MEDFNYFINKAINQYINKRYNIYDINQQTTDDLRVLKATAILPVTKVENKYNGLTTTGQMATYETTLPSDYLHLLNCICIYNVAKTYKCYNQGDTWRAAATRLTADAYSQVLDNFWNRPTYKRPYYYIHNINVNPTNPTNPYTGAEGIVSETTRNITDSQGNIIKTVVTSRTINYEYDSNGNPTNPSEKGTDISGVTQNTSDGNTIHTVTTSGGLPKTIKIGGIDASNIERSGEIRYGNVS